MQAVFFRAGLGDVIRTIYLTQAYKFISETTEPVKVISASHNPFTTEIFRYHRNSKNFLILELGHKYEQLLNAGLRAGDLDRAICEFAEVRQEDLFTGKKLPDFVPQFNAPDDVESSGHLIFQPFAGSVADRTFSDALMSDLVRILEKLPCHVYLITRSFTRKSNTGRLIHASEDARRFTRENITVMEHLSVPATLNLVKSSSAYLGCWSSLQQAAWFENKPVAVLYPPNWCDVVKRTGYAFGLDRPDCFHTDFKALDLDRLQAWLAQWISHRPASPAPPGSL
ncbi:hypothetical protein DES53_109126 [Roseimicrobium gellanilyticum]|uniref:ADP-heptose:LPS heptosyltransferase n=1 Tax=Roseimicrobium gellanilyticum TaxID=748857 RepID=A0A366HCY6_9BACT|nr:hypothetical protein [Roseimicrobium gellanilyticum]RBP39699.1 hypothetical protein DES53_109126 [Roseimicrobium gellanilyticum]